MRQRKKQNSTIIHGNYVAFKGGPFSNWYPVEIEYDNIRFKNSEQLFMYLKARFFKDDKSAELIAKTPNPAKAKELGRSVVNFDKSLWDQKSYNFMSLAVSCKFEQNTELLQELFNPKYKGKHFVESSSEDCIWGTGLDWKDEKIADRGNWKGQNKLGEILDMLRFDLKSNMLAESNELIEDGTALRKRLIETVTNFLQCYGTSIIGSMDGNILTVELDFNNNISVEMRDFESDTTTKTTKPTMDMLIEICRYIKRRLKDEKF